MPDGPARDVAAIIFEPLARTAHLISAPLIIVAGIVDSADRARNVSGAATMAVTQDVLAILSQLSAPDQLATLTGVGIVGFGDQPSEVDLLGRSSIIQTLVYLLIPALPDIGASVSPDESGPTLVSLEGPWGMGKTTFLRHLRKAVDELSPTTKSLFNNSWLSLVRNFF